jgi:cell division protein FtsB
LGTAALLFLLLLNEGAWRTFQRKREIHRLERELAQAREQVQWTHREIESLKEDKSYLDILTQRELGLLKPDEIEIRFVSSASAGSSAKD